MWLGAGMSACVDWALRGWAHACYGGDAARYAKGEYYLDIHPPLARLTLLFAGKMLGYEATFPFEYVQDVYESPAQ